MEEMGVPQARKASFQTALYQFLFPLVEFGTDRMPIRMSDLSLVNRFDDTIFEGIDSPSSSEPQAPRTSSGRCKAVAVVRPPLPSDFPSQEAPAPSGPSLSGQKRKKAQKPSARLKKRTLATTAGKQGELATAVDKQDEQEEEHRKVSDKTKYFRDLKKSSMYQVL
jgi:hypothetical protein